VVVLTCIDARINPAKALGLEIGDAHVISDVEQIRNLKALPEGLSVSGHIYDVRSGTIQEVVPADRGAEWSETRAGNCPGPHRPANAF